MKPLSLLERRPGRFIGFLASTCICFFSPARGSLAAPEAAKNQSKLHAPLTLWEFANPQVLPARLGTRDAARSTEFRTVLAASCDERVVPVRKKCGRASICCH